MASKKPVYFHIRQDLSDGIRLVAAAEKVTMTSVVEAALEAFLPIRKEQIEAKLESAADGARQWPG